MHRVPRSVCVVLTLSALALIPHHVVAASQASLIVSPQPAMIGKPATISGSNLKPGRFYTFLIAASGPIKPGTRALIQTLGRADSSGNMRVRVKIPVIVRCGPATLYATAGRSTVTAQLVVRGCKASAKSGGPPPPPASHKKPKS